MVRSHHGVRWFCSSAALALLLAAQSASALVSVCAANCSSTTIQGAINQVLAAERAGAADPFIAVAGINGDGSTAVYAEALKIDASGIGGYDVFGTHFDHAFVQIFGDYDQLITVEVGAPAFVTASGGKPDLEITGGSPVSVVLNHLTLAAATVAGNGGGINFHGSGSLDLSNVDISLNSAGAGAGIFADGQGSGIALTLHSGTLILDNHAAHSGGGIRIQGTTHLFVLEDQTWISGNTVAVGDGDGSGGGIAIAGATALADIGSPGFGGLGLISGNSARNGGGIAVSNGGTARVFSTVAGVPARIVDNVASNGGGGIYVDGTTAASSVCADGYGIERNSALNGAAIFGSSSTVDLRAAAMQCNAAAALPARAACPAGRVCNTIDGNETAGGDVISLVQSGLAAERVEIRGNSGSSLLHVNSGTATLTNCLVAGNTGAQTLIAALAGAELGVLGCTFASNGFSNAAFFSSGDFSLHQSIVWQPEMTTLDAASDLAHVSAVDLIVTDDDSFYGLSFAESLNVSDRDPGFVDAAGGDFHLRPESLAVDNASSGPGTDIEGNPRPVNLLHQNGLGLYDLGPYELQDKGEVIFSDGMDRIIFN